MKSYYQYLTTPTSDTQGTTLLVHFDRKRYLFGSAGEGLQRAAVQQGARVLKISEVFISGRTVWANVGGILGLILVLADGVSSAAAAVASAVRAKVFGSARDEDLSKEEYDRLQKEYLDRLNKEKQSLTLYGPGNLNYMLATARRFIFRTSMPLMAQEVPAMLAGRSPEEQGPATFLFKDDYIRVWGLSVPPTTVRSQPSGELPVRNERKRSHEEMNGVDNGYQVTDSNGVEQSLSVLELTKKIVFEMFSSDWRIDRLFECPIEEVKLPAKLFVRNSKTNKIEQYNGPLPGQQGYKPHTQVLVRSPWPGAVISDRLPAPPPTRESVSYIVRTYPQRGKFDPKKALELGLKDKSKWRHLTMGESLQNDKGETITPDMVLEPSKDATGFVVADLPSADYIEPFVDQIANVPAEVIGGVGAYSWILGPGVYDDPRLQKFIASKPDLQHMVTAPDVCEDRLSFDSAASATVKLSGIDPVRYKIPFIREQTGPRSMPSNAIIADRGQIFQLEPANKLSDEELTPRLNIPAVLNEVIPNAKVEAEKAEAEMKRDEATLKAWASKVPDSESEIITIGTGSALPSKYRNVSATLVRVPGWGSILLDAGENTIGQLRRIYSPTEFKEVMNDLRCIWISHLHADHHLGTASVIKTWYQTVHNSTPVETLDPSSPSFNPVMHIGRSKQLTVMSDSAMLHWLWEYAQLEDFGYSRVIPITATPGTSNTDSNTMLNWFSPPAPRGTTPPLSPRTQRIRTRLAPFSLGFLDIQACPVRHCNGSLAVSLTLPSGFKLSYSGDCRPSNRFAEIGAGSTVCIHEATFDDELKSDAVAKRHSTTGEALRVAAKMRAKAVVLTHFSQRYAKVPVLEYEDGSETDGEKIAEDEGEVGDDEDADAAGTENYAGKGGAGGTVPEEGEEGPGQVGQATFKLHANRDMKVCVAFDYMRVKVGDIAKMERYVPALLALYEGEEKRRDEEKKREKEELERKKKEKDKGKSKWMGNKEQKGEQKKEGKQQRQKQSQKPKKDQSEDVKVGNGSSGDKIREALKRRRSSKMDTSEN